MSPISLCLNLFLATLLLATLMLGWRLDRRLRALKDSHAGFASAVADLDRAAQRAEKGLSELRAATDEAVDLLAGRIEKGRELAARLDRLAASSAAAAERAETKPISALERVWAKPANEPVSQALADAEAAAESLVLKLSQAEVLEDGRILQAAPRPSPRSRAVIDDDLFEAPARGALRAFAGGR